MANSSQRNEFVLSRFHGLLTDVDPFKAPVGSASSVRNVEVSPLTGKLAGSPGVFGDNVAGSSATLIHEYEIVDGSGVVLTNYGGNLCVGTSPVVIGTHTEIVDGQSVEVQEYQALGTGAFGVNMQGKTFFTDGSAYCYYDGNVEFGSIPAGAWGTLQAPGTPTLSTVNTGGHGHTTGGVHRYFVVWSDSPDPTASGAHVSSPSAIDDFTASDEEAEQHFTTTGGAYYTGDPPDPLPELPSWAKYLCVFMTQADSQGFKQGTFYFANSAEITGTGPTSAEVDIDIADSELGLPWKPFSVPPACKAIATYMDRICVANAATHPSRLYFSEASDPFRFGDDNWIDVGTDTGDSITSIGAIPAGLLIVMSRSVHILTGYSPATFRVTRISENTGSTQPRGTILHGGAAYWVNPYGLWMTSGGKPVNLAEKRIVKYLSTVTWNGSGVVGSYCPQNNQLWFSMSNGDILAYDLLSNEFILRKFTHSVAAMGVCTLTGIPKMVYMAGGPTLYIVGLSIPDTSDESQDRYWTSNWMDFGTSRKKRLTQILIEYDKQTAGTMTVAIDASDGPASTSWTTTLTVDHTAAPYIIPVSMQGRYFRVKFSVNAEGKTIGISKAVFYHLPAGVN